MPIQILIDLIIEIRTGKSYCKIYINTFYNVSHAYVIYTCIANMEQD